MVLKENSSTMELSEDCGGNIRIQEIKPSTSGSKIVSNRIFNNYCTSTDKDTKTLPNKYVDITADSQNEKDISSSMGEDELCKMVTEMVEQEHTSKSRSTSQNLSTEGIIQQSIIHEQAQLLNSYNHIIDLPEDIQRQIIKPFYRKESLVKENTQQVPKSHLLPWMTKEYTKLICPNKDSHMVTIKKKEHINMTNHMRTTPMLSHEKSNKDTSLENNDPRKYISNNYSNKNNDLDKYQDETTEAAKELNQKCEVTITRIRGIHKIDSKNIKSYMNENTQENLIPTISNSFIDAPNPKDGKSLKPIFSTITDQPIKTEEKLMKLENLSGVTMSNSNANIVLHPPMPIFSSGSNLSEAKPSTSTDNKTREQMIMIQELQTMVPPNIYPQQSVKTFENGNLLLVAPLNANQSICTNQRSIKPKVSVSKINSDTNNTGIKMDKTDVTEDSVVSYKHLTSLHSSMPIVFETSDQNMDVTNILPNKIKFSNDSLLYDMRLGLEGIEMKEKIQNEESITSGGNKKRRRNGIYKEKKWQLEEELSDAEEEKKRQNAKKAKEHREKKKDEITALKNENFQWQIKCKELEAENKQLKSQVEMLKSIFPMLNVNKIPET